MLIAGGGIAGLASALALARKGFRSTVLEQASDFREVGAGIQLGPNALRALGQLGLREEISRHVSWPQQICVRDTHSGQVLNRLVLDKAFSDRYRESYATIHRADLLSVLVEACRRHPGLIELRNNIRVLRIEAQEDAIEVLDDRGINHRADSLLGADGLWSRVRAHVVSEALPRFSGDVALRALVPNTAGLRDINLWLGPQLHVVAYPVRAGDFLNLVAICEYPEGRDLRGWEEPAPQQALQRFTGHHPMLSDLLLRASDWAAWPLLDRDPIREWSRGRVCLLGDAAHPSLQYMAQGACLALEDAVCLADILAGGEARKDPASAFRTFSQARHARAARMILTTRRLGKIYHARGPLRLARNVSMRLMPASMAREMMAWVYDY